MQAVQRAAGVSISMAVLEKPGLVGFFTLFTAGWLFRKRVY
jgi:hypothetical protein